jgi:hypothetical protein
MTISNMISVDLADSIKHRTPAAFVRNLVVAFVPVLVLILLCAAFLGAPQSRELTLQDWAQASPTDFVLTAAEELVGTSHNDSFGPPYNSLSQGESLGPIRLQRFGGLGVPIIPAQDFVIEPLKINIVEGVYSAIGAYRGLSNKAQGQALMGALGNEKANLNSALRDWVNASIAQQIKWTKRYISALNSVGNRQKILTDPAFGPVKILTDELLFLAQAGTLDGILTTQNSPYATDFTKTMLFLGDGNFIQDSVRTAHLDSKRLALSSGTNSYPGQFWLIPYSSWYSIKPFSSSKNADIEVSAIVLLICLATIYLPKIPIFSTLPRVLPFHHARSRRLK